eukprot:8930580-Ditylum_brightwellii.AAC.1
MDNKTSDYRGKGVEFIQAIVPVYRSKWPLPERLKKQADFFNMFQRSDESVDTYSTKFLHAKQELTWNNIVFNEDKLHEIFILSLGSEFTSLHNNMSSLPD